MFVITRCAVVREYTVLFMLCCMFSCFEFSSCNDVIPHRFPKTKLYQGPTLRKMVPQVYKARMDSVRYSVAS